MKKLVVLALTAAISAGALAQTFPSKPITIVVPFAAGGPTDLVARQLAEAMRKPLGDANIIVENAAGAGGTIGTPCWSGTSAWPPPLVCTADCRSKPWMILSTWA